MLIIKLRSANTAETRQYKKATKALLVLIPLLGITYLVVLTVPKDDSVGSNLFTYLQAFLISTQVSWLTLVISKSILKLSLLQFHRVSPFRFSIVSWILKWNKHCVIDGKSGVRHGTLEPMHNWNIGNIITASIRKSIRHSVHALKVYGKTQQTLTQLCTWIFRFQLLFFTLFFV